METRSLYCPECDNEVNFLSREIEGRDVRGWVLEMFYVWPCGHEVVPFGSTDGVPDLIRPIDPIDKPPEVW